MSQANILIFISLSISCLALWVSFSALNTIRKTKLNNRLLELRILISDLLHDIRIIALHFESFGLSKDSQSVIEIQSGLAQMEHKVLVVHNQLYASPLKFNDMALNEITQEFKFLNEEFEQVKTKIEVLMKKHSI